MNDLISRKALIDIFQQKADGNSGLLRNNMLFAKKVVESMPTAYDVEKVIDKLENKVFSAECYNDDFNGCEINNLLCMGDVYEIVKGGEIDG